VDAATLFREGKLLEATDACQQQLRERPQDGTLRTLLFELLAFQGEWDRASKQLDVLAKQHTDSEWATQVYQNLLAAERLRQTWFTGPTGLPGFLNDPSESVRQRCDALRALHQGDGARAAELLANASSDQPELEGTLGSEPFVGLRDCDDTLSGILELMILRDYIWVPWEQVRELEVAAPERPRDLLWAPVRLVLADAVQRRGYVPVRYAASHTSQDDAIRLGRLTDWVEHPGGIITGIGLKTCLLGDRGASILELGDLTVHPVGSS
jgi:type VI secretion system protein ImpE